MEIKIGFFPKQNFAKHGMGLESFHWVQSCILDYFTSVHITARLIETNSFAPILSSNSL